MIMYEPWVMDVDLSNVNLDVSDPDHPTVAKLSKTSNKQERTGMGIIKIIQWRDCIRGGYAEYLGDGSSNGKPFILTSMKILLTVAFSFTTYNTFVLQSTSWV